MRGARSGSLRSTATHPRRGAPKGAWRHGRAPRPLGNLRRMLLQWQLHPDIIGSWQVHAQAACSSQSQQGLRRVHWHGHASGLPGSMQRPPLARTRVPGPHWQTRTQ